MVELLEFKLTPRLEDIHELARKSQIAKIESYYLTQIQPNLGKKGALVTKSNDLYYQSMTTFDLRRQAYLANKQ